MDIWSTDKLTLFLIFFLPGFISMKVYDLMVPSAPREAAKSLHEAISYSALNFGFWSWLIALLFAGDYYHRHFIWFSFAVVLILLVAPIFWPFAYLKLASWAPIAKTTSPTPFKSPGTTIFRKANFVLDYRSPQKWAQNRRALRHKVFRVL